MRAEYIQRIFTDAGKQVSMKPFKAFVQPGPVDDGCEQNPGNCHDKILVQTSGREHRCHEQYKGYYTHNVYEYGAFLE